MRTETKTYNLYSLHELSEKAQQRAYEDWSADYEYSWNDFNIGTLAKFEEVFDLRVIEWNYDAYTYNFRFVPNIPRGADNLKGVRLATYLTNNYGKILYIPKTYWLNRKKRESRILTSNDCVLTGYCADYAILEPIYNFLRKPENTTYYHLLRDCLDSFFKYCKEDVEYSQGKDAFEEYSIANNYEYLSDGKKYV